jgi:hypothetical protein
VPVDVGVALEIANLALAAYMAGVGWLVQAVVYPGFALVGAGEWAAFHAAHSRRITPVVAPAMIGQAGVAVALLAERPGVLTAVNLALAGGLLAVTGTVFPWLHRRQPGAQRQLLRANAARTAAWSAATAVAAALALGA